MGRSGRLRAVANGFSMACVWRMRKTLLKPGVDTIGIHPFLSDRSSVEPSLSHRGSDCGFQLEDGIDFVAIRFRQPGSSSRGELKHA